MQKHLLVLAALTALSATAQAQDIYGGVGMPGLVALGYAQPMGNNWGLRGELAGGYSRSDYGSKDGVNLTRDIKASRVGVFADWFPFNNNFRLVGGLTVSDIKASFRADGAVGNFATINGKSVNMFGETFDVNISYPTTTPYLGIGFGHQASQAKGLGFYADVGVMVGSFNTDVSTSLVANGKLTQSDVDAQVRKFRDSLSSVSVLPNASVGLSYRY